MASGRTNPWSRALGAGAAVGWSVAFFVLFATAIVALGSLRPGAEYDDVNGALLDAASALLVIYVVARVHAPTASTREVVGARPVGFLGALLAAAMGGAAMVPLSALHGYVATRFPVAEARVTEMTHVLASMGRTERIAGVVLTLLLVPIFEELLFRGALATGIARAHGRLLALVVPAIAFGAVSSGLFATAFDHPTARDFLDFGFWSLVGLIVGVARLGTGSVLGAIAAHFAWRAADLANDWRVAHSIDPLVTATYPYPRWPLAAIAGSSVVVVAAGLLLVRAGRSEERNEDVPLPPAPEGPSHDED